MIGNATYAHSTEFAKVARVFSVCLFPCGAVVPDVELVKAANDGEAIQLVKTKYPSGDVEIWDRWRLVAHLRSDSSTQIQLKPEASSS